MHPAALAERNAVATRRINATVETLAARTGIPLPNLKHGNVHDPAAAALFQRESIADFLDALVASGESGPVEVKVASDDRTVAELVPLIAELDAEGLAEVEAAEQGGKGRKGVLEAIAARRDALAAESEPDLNELPDGQLR